MATKQIPWQLALPFSQFTECLSRIMIYASKSKCKRLNRIVSNCPGIVDCKVAFEIVKIFNQIKHETNAIIKSCRYLSKLSKEMMDSVETEACISINYGEKILVNRNLSITFKGKEMLECLIFGWIRKLIEDKYNLMIPNYLKMVCLEFYGNIVMDTNILNVNQLNTFGYVLKSIFDLKQRKQFYAQKISECKTDGFDSELLDKKCGTLPGEYIIILKTNANHIVSFCYLDFSDLRKQIGCILQSPESPISAIPMVYAVPRDVPDFINGFYHFANDFVANFKKKLSEVVTEYNNIIESAVYSIKNPPNKKNKLYIMDFEIFLVQ